MTFERTNWSEGKYDRVTYGKADMNLPPTPCLHVWPERSRKEPAWREYLILAFCIFISSGDGIFLTECLSLLKINNFFCVIEATVWGINLSVWITLCVCRGSAPFLIWRFESKLMPEHEKFKCVWRQALLPVFPLLFTSCTIRHRSYEAVLILYLQSYYYHCLIMNSLQWSSGNQKRNRCGCWAGATLEGVITAESLLGDVCCCVRGTGITRTSAHGQKAAPV